MSIRHIVIAGPCVSEFGWELMEWQGYVRCLSRGADSVIVCSTAGFEPIYADMNSIYIPHTIQCVRDAHRLHTKTVKNMPELARVQAILNTYCINATKRKQLVIRVDDTIKKLQRRPIGEQVFIKYGDAAKAGTTYPLVIHARNRPEPCQFGGDNYSSDNWELLLNDLIAEGIVSDKAMIAAIGTKIAALAPSGVTDLRDIPIQQLMNILSAATLVIGPSSGPMHLASLCGTPHFVWATNCYQRTIGPGNRERYITRWNPLNTKAHVVLHPKGQQLSPAVLAEAVIKFWHDVTGVHV